MAKYNIDDAVLHSRYGAGKIVRVGTRKVTPPAIDRRKLDGERWTIKARLAEIEALMARSDEPYDEDFYRMAFEDGQGRQRTLEGNNDTVDKLAARAAGAAEE